jgi:hypothetical protein
MGKHLSVAKEGIAVVVVVFFESGKTGKSGKGG